MKRETGTPEESGGRRFSKAPYRIPTTFWVPSSLRIVQNVVLVLGIPSSTCWLYATAIILESLAEPGQSMRSMGLRPRMQLKHGSLSALVAEG
ncbi:hypothetical protein O181_041340 [Austropuccinia psidii MF-1]|uniref:Uncharacterized protein n=1 Tax=Austropuccinia psidii MF-1 TaxID=1389203 RepID=A0A9Q3HH21_9BASI|nr:hypothetical protein [Austropuccinia psidii MF-1]